MLARALAWSIGAVQAPGESVQWEAPPGCPDGATVLAEVSRRLGRPLAPDEARAQGRVVRDGRGYALRLELAAGERSETRELRDPSCVALADAAALLIVAAVAPQEPVVPPPVPPPTEVAVAEPPASEPVAELPASEPVEAPAPVAEVALPEVAPQPVRKDISRGPGGFVRLHGGGEYGAVPGVTGMVGLAGGLLWRRVRLELQGAAVVPRTSSGHPLADVRVGLFVAAVHVCGRLGRGAVEVPLCGGVEAGAARGEVPGLPGWRVAVVPWVAGVLGPALAWHAGRRWSVWAAAQLVLAPVRPVFLAGVGKEDRELFKPAVASGRLLLGVEMRFGDPW